MNRNVHVVIMAGGTGQRFWPKSRESRPKQFLDILGTGKSLLQLTYERFTTFIHKYNIYISTNEKYKDIVNEQLPSIDDHQLLLEPEKRNTAPCVAYAVYKIGSKYPHSPIIIAPSDHLIINDEKFFEALQYAIDATNFRTLLTLGIKPNRPATGYGYINYQQNNDKAKRVISFTEKPTKEVANQFVKSGKYFWNAGIFIGTAQAFKHAYKSHLPAIDELFESMNDSYFTDNEYFILKQQYKNCENISIDYGIMEKYHNTYVVLGEFGWSDLGSWASLYEQKVSEKGGNVIEGNVLSYKVKNSIIKGKKEKVIVVHGLDGYVVIDDEDALLICKKDDEVFLKKAIDKLEKNYK